MSDWRLLSNLNGKKTELQKQSDGTVLICSLQECDPVLDHNKFLRDHVAVDRRSEMHHVASIPNVIVAQWLAEGIDVYSGDCQDRVARKLNDPDYLTSAPVAAR